MTADIVVVTWNSGERVLRCLERIMSQAEGHVVRVVDNASADSTVALVRARFPGVDVTELPANIGFGRAVNTAVEAGSADAIVLVNDDVEIAPGAIDALVRSLEVGRVGMVAGLTTIPNTELVDGFGIELDVTLAAYNRLRRLPMDRTPGVLLGPSGGLAAYRRRAFEAVGGFDPRFTAYGEDVDLALRLRLAGWDAAASPEARGVHLGGASVGVDSPAQRRLAGFARGFILRRYDVLRTRHAPRALAFEALIVVAGLARGRTLEHIRGRLEGWRAAAAGDTLPVPIGAVDVSIAPREVLRRLMYAR
jgi:N-acetylglucosaminyl-diphospho-decaprenol L-rhamnosyltransferase